MSLIQEGLEKLNLNSSVIELLAIATGPGSYTGIRVGAAAVLGLAFPRNLPIVSFSSLEGFISHEEGQFASLIDARIGGAYVLLQQKKEGNIVFEQAPQFVPSEEISAYTASYPVQAGPHISYPDSEYLAKRVAQKFREGSYSTDIQLTYLRTPEYLPSRA